MKFPYEFFGLIAQFRIKSFLPYLVSSFKKEKKEDILWKAFPQAIFEILVNVEQYSHERLTSIVELLDMNLLGERNMKITLMMFKVGVRYFKENDNRAIYDLSKEERKVFNEFVLEKRKA